LVARRIVDKPLAVDQPDFKLRALIVGERFNGCARDERMAL
jgi:hypothetical protein